jgi:type IV pilus assembly protein PilV
MAADLLVRRPRVRPACQRGVSLIEMLITLVLVSIGLIGLMGVLARARTVSTDAEDRGRAAMLASDIASQMMLNHGVNLPAAFLNNWIANVASNPQKGGLNAGTATVVAAADNDGGAATAADNVATITITWTSTGNVNHSYTTKVIVP